MGWGSVALWLLTRGFVVWLLLGPESWVGGDVTYFADSLAALGERGLSGSLVEYPVAGVVAVAVPWLVALWLGHPDLYAELLMTTALVTDAAFAVLLSRFGGSRRSAALVVWLLAVPFLGATTYARFDLLPGVLVGVAVLLLASHPRFSAGAAAVATGLKLWPALLLPALSARASTRRSVVTVAAVVGSALALTSLALAGWGRLWSPLTWQVDRGLQIESVPASPAMLGWALGPDGFHVAYADSNAFEVTGPGVSALLTVATVLGVLVAAGLLVMWVRAWRSGASLSPDAVVWLCLAAVAGFMVSSKVLSPQYLLWLLPATAAGLAVVETGRGRHRLWRWALVLLAATVATHLVFPVLYGDLTTHHPDSWRVVLLLLVRNAMLVWLLARAVTEAWWHLQPKSGAQRGIPLERQPPGPEGNTARTFR